MDVDPGNENRDLLAVLTVKNTYRRDWRGFQENWQVKNGYFLKNELTVKNGYAKTVDFVLKSG